MGLTGAYPDNAPPTHGFTKVLIANRGAIACRIIRTLKKMEIASLAVYSEADRHALHVRMADEAVCLGPAPAAQSYLDAQHILAVAQQHGVDAIHPGYGFLSENAAFAEACAAAGIVFIGPTPKQMRDFGRKHTARQIARDNGVPLLPGSGLLDDLPHARREALRIGYPVMLKSTAGGGGIGMQLCPDEKTLDEAFRSVERLARNHFNEGGIYLEKFVDQARHIEVQLFGDGQGTIVTLGERDCSVQRRNQKVIEESPAPGIDAAVRTRLLDAAQRLGIAVAYRSAGTVEFVFDPRSRAFYFLEVNTRLQVEHGVTEAVTGVDLVEWMLRVAAGETAFLRAYRHQPQGWAVQARLYAEDPNKHFQPCSGLLTQVTFPDTVRVDSWVETGSTVSAYYDPMLAKLIATGRDRNAALATLEQALQATTLAGIETNRAWLCAIVADETFRAAQHTTRYLDRFHYRPDSIEVIAPGTQSIVVDYPGRVGYWAVGVPPSGPMDDLAFRLGNRILGNPPDAAGLELTVTGPTLRFHTPTVIALTGAPMQASLDGTAIGFWQAVRVPAGAVLKLGRLEKQGYRSYLNIRGGLDVPRYMGSRTTFTLGQFGGHVGRALLAGDVLHINPRNESQHRVTALATALRPRYTNHWQLRVLYGPHGAPDFFTSNDIQTLFSSAYEVHYNSSRTGVRLIGPSPEWARQDGGEAGLHPSNIHDNAYAIGTIDFTGDMPIILGPDGPSLGGFVCPATVVQADLWKIGQLRPGDTVRFQCITNDDAAALLQAQDRAIATLTTDSAMAVRSVQPTVSTQAILSATAAQASQVAVCYRQAGDHYLLIEYGPQQLDLSLRFRVHALMTWLEAQAIEGIIDLTPGIRSLQVHYDSRMLSQSRLLDHLRQAEAELPASEDMCVPSRIVHLPLAWDDPSTQLAIEKYMQSVRPDAPWCPSNIEFIRRINGLEHIDDVKRIVYAAHYLVLGLGDVYLGAPVATPLDPRHRLVTTKYNPARTWTPENAVGIGGAYLCVYGMEGPGGYQFVGRTVQMWNRYRQTADFSGGKQWLLRFFDQIRFYPVSAAELQDLREGFPHGETQLQIETTTLKLGDHLRFLDAHEPSITAFKQRQQAAFTAERQRWVETGQANFETRLPDDAAMSDASFEIPEGCIAIASPVTGSVWKLAVTPGATVTAGDLLVVVEAMKMEIEIHADESGCIEEILCAPGSPVSAGQSVLLLKLNTA